MIEAMEKLYIKKGEIITQKWVVQFIIHLLLIQKFSSSRWKL